MSDLTLAQSIRQRQLLALSDERDQWQQLLIQMARESYAAGYADGQAGEIFEQDRVWAARLPVPLAIGPTFAELEQRRWGPGGREHFGDPRPVDYPGGAL